MSGASGPSDAPGRGFAIAVLLAVLAGVAFAFWMFERIVATA